MNVKSIDIGFTMDRRAKQVKHNTNQFMCKFVASLVVILIGSVSRICCTH